MIEHVIINDVDEKYAPPTRVLQVAYTDYKEQEVYLSIYRFKETNKETHMKLIDSITVRLEDLQLALLALGAK